MARVCYTEEQLHFLRAFRNFALDIVTGAFNHHFGVVKTKSAIHCAYSNHDIPRPRKTIGRSNGHAVVYTRERKEWLREHYPLMPQPELTAAYNEQFGTDHTVDQIKSALGRFGILSGRTGYYAKGETPWNKGVTGYMGANRTSFTKGSVPPNRVPMWTERVSKDGYIEMKVPERNPHTGFPTRFKCKHLWLWEQEHGPLPSGHVVIFLDGDFRNFALENLHCVPRKVLLNLNIHDYKNAPAEVKPSILALARLEAEAGIRSIRAAGSGRKCKEPTHAVTSPDQENPRPQGRSQAR